ncbi:nitric oxide associated protein 1 [Dimargaris xerosporica]|nr:nitric oxide associated protein 1 [Dimargaris xerosporica]
MFTTRAAAQSLTKRPAWALGGGRLATRIPNHWPPTLAVQYLIRLGLRHSSHTNALPSLCSAQSTPKTQLIAIESPASESVIPLTDYCPGCGAAFQTSNSRKPGYLPSIKSCEEATKGYEAYRQKVDRSDHQHLSPADYQARYEALDESLRVYFPSSAGSTVNTSLAHPVEHDGTITDDTSPAPALEVSSADSASADTKPLSESNGPVVRRLVCKRCHDMTHHNRVETIWHNDVAKDPDILTFMRNRPRALVLHVVDIYDLPTSLLKGLTNYIGSHHDVILVANKVDLLPKDVHWNRVAVYLQRMLVDTGIHNVIAVHLVSARKVHGVRELCRDIVELRQQLKHRHCDLYMVGRANVGKSELVNAMLRISYGGSPHKVTTYPVPGTTSDMLRVPLELFKRVLVGANEADTGILYDTPGIFNSHSLIKYLTPPELKQCLPKSHLKPLTYRIHQGQSLCLGGLGRIDLDGGGASKVLMTVFSAVPVHITKIDKAVAQCDALAQGNRTVLHPPYLHGKNRAATFPPFRLVERYELTSDHPTMACTDIVFAGVGWVAIAGQFQGAQLAVHSPGGRGVSIRSPLLPFEYKHKITKYRSNMRKQR